MNSTIPTLDAFASARVLIVDDNPANVDLLAALLTRAGIDGVLTESDARRAVSRIESDAPHLVLLDLHMPFVDGYEILGQIRAVWAALEVPVAVLTADTTRRAVHRALSLGANDFITKPIDVPEVVLRVRNLLEARSLHSNLQERERWVGAAVRLSQDLLSGEVEEPMPLVADLTRELSDADVVIATVDAAHSAQPSGQLNHLVLGGIGGMSPETIASWIDPIVAGLTLDGAAPVIFADHALETETVGSQLGPVMVLPLSGQTGVCGALSLCRARGREPFAAMQFEAAKSFAQQAAVALEFADARREQQRMLILEDRDRIARDLHDHVIQRLFAVGLRMQTSVTMPDPAELAESVSQWSDELDETILQIRSSIFMLRDTRVGASRSLRARLRALTHDVSDALGFAPHLHVVGPVDTAVSIDLADDVIAVVREALTNAAKHADASRVEVAVTVTATDVRVEVVDDGCGVGEPVRRSGIGNLETRALRHGGTFEIGTPVEGGTRLHWQARLR